MRRAVLVGVGGHARSVIEAVRAGDALEIVGATDRKPSAERSPDGVPILGDDSLLPGLLADGVTAAVIGVGGVRDNRPRQRVYERLVELGFELPVVAHPGAVVALSAELGPGTLVLAGAVVGAGARVGADVIVNTGAVVEHDCQIADHVHLATGALLAGEVVVAEGAHVGIGACVLQGRSIGRGAVVAAGAVVTRDVPADTVVVGVPAAPLPASS